MERKGTEYVGLIGVHDCGNGNSNDDVSVVSDRIDSLRISDSIKRSKGPKEDP